MIEKETDYDNLFFVIDDPISSMDFHFVYAVTQVLRSIKSIFGMSSYVRLWVFTHNIEFFSIMVRNNIIGEKNAYMLKPGKVVRFNHTLLLPYENHLIDLLNIAEGSTEPDHTTGNSIRHVIETISKFEEPGIKLANYVAKTNLLKDDFCIFTLCQDLSHGAMRKEPPYDEEMLRNACKKVINFVESRYPKQIDNLRSENGCK